MSPTTRHGSALMLTALLFAPSLAADDWDDDIEAPAANAAANAAAPAPVPQPPRPNVTITLAESAQLNDENYRHFSSRCKREIDNIDHWHPCRERTNVQDNILKKQLVDSYFWDLEERGGGDHSYRYPSREDIARRIQRQNNSHAANERLSWAQAMDVAKDVFDILQAFKEESSHSGDLQDAYFTLAKWAPWTFGLTLTGWKVEDDKWYSKVHPHVVTIRMALVGDNAFRNALEVFLQLRDAGKSVGVIRQRMPEVYAALASVIEPTDLQLDELSRYDRTRTE